MTIFPQRPDFIRANAFAKLLQRKPVSDHFRESTSPAFNTSLSVPRTPQSTPEDPSYVCVFENDPVRHIELDILRGNPKGQQFPRAKGPESSSNDGGAPDISKKTSTPLRRSFHDGIDNFLFGSVDENVPAIFFAKFSPVFYDVDSEDLAGSKDLQGD